MKFKLKKKNSSPPPSSGEQNGDKDDIIPSDSLYVDPEMILASLVHTTLIFMKLSIPVIPTRRAWCCHYRIT